MSCISTTMSALAHLIMGQGTHKCLGDDHQTIYVELVLAQVQKLECPITLQHLRKIGDTRLKLRFRCR